MAMFHHVYPASEALQKRVPLWLKFFAYEYTHNSFLRSNNYGAAGIPPSGLPLLGSVFVPAPTEFSTLASASYNTAINSKETETKADPSKTLKNIADVFGLGDIVDDITSMIPDVAGAIKKVNDLTIGNLVNMDMSDTTFQGMNKRMYQFKLLLGAVTEEDSTAASGVAEFFQAYQLPTAIPVLGQISKTVRHPPLWFFGIGPGSNPNIDSDWCGQPQFALLNAVTVNKSGFKNSYAISEGSSLKPLAQSISLSFVELEPALSAAFSTTIINRSTSWYGLGGIGAGAARAVGSVIGG
jgi:hypothetical protein